VKAEFTVVVSVEFGSCTAGASQYNLIKYPAAADLYLVKFPPISIPQSVCLIILVIFPRTIGPTPKPIQKSKTIFLDQSLFSSTILFVGTPL
jgi:hypothetical protein